MIESKILDGQPTPTNGTNKRKTDDADQMFAHKEHRAIDVGPIVKPGILVVGRYDWGKKRGPAPKGFRCENIHVGHPLSPFILKTSEGYLIENYWQFSKVYAKVYAQDKSITIRGVPTTVWKWKAEKHTDGPMNDPLPAYWEWRKAGFNNPLSVRYPNGYHHRHEVLYTLYVDQISGKQFRLDYIQARKIIYVPYYQEAARKTKEYQEMLNYWLNGGNLCISDVDGPSTKSKILKGKITKDNYVVMSADLLIQLMEETEAPFGHGYALAAAFMNVRFK